MRQFERRKNGSLLDPFKGHRLHGWQLTRISKRRINHGFDTPLEIAATVDRPTFVKSDSFVRSRNHVGGGLLQFNHRRSGKKPITLRIFLEVAFVNFRKVRASRSTKSIAAALFTILSYDVVTQTKEYEDTSVQRRFRLYKESHVRFHNNSNCLFGRRGLSSG